MHRRASKPTATLSRLAFDRSRSYLPAPRKCRSATHSGSSPCPDPSATDSTSALAYAIWAGLGTALIVAIGALFLHQPLTPAKIFAIALIVVGVVVLNLSGAH
ncbi:DMT family transporter [Nocardia transvalensis]|uniref:DMT family transporter n=1 Tax=Nocardia transvalensis TaxID=37333 RepID=UPI0018953ACB|nr:SMR family transporter [Nocardia transvalensis]MBF6334251.1 hypothetical protein [Nocardia transvalensis]